MKTNNLICIAIALNILLFTVLSCQDEDYENATGVSKEEFKTHIVSDGFQDNDSYMIICKGNIPVDKSGPAAFESGKRAALLTAYFIAKQKFGSDFQPDRFGNLEDIEKEGDHVVIHYLLKMPGLKDLYRE